MKMKLIQDVTTPRFKQLSHLILPSISAINLLLQTCSTFEDIACAPPWGQEGLWVAELTLVTGSNCLFVCLSVSILQLCCQARWGRSSERAAMTRSSHSDAPTVPASRFRWRSTASLHPPGQCAPPTPRLPDSRSCRPMSPASGPTHSRSVQSCTG
jgi:hypothetical protein